MARIARDLRAVMSRRGARQESGNGNLEFDLNNIIVRAQWETGPQPSLRDVTGNPSVPL